MKIENVIQSLNLPKPATITSILQADELIEKDLQGLNLSNITDKNTIRQLSSDLTIFNDYAFRYYTLQFMSYYFLSYDYLFLTLFIPAYKKTDGQLTNDSNRFLQFGQKEVKTILYFFQYLNSEIKFLKNKFKGGIPNNLNSQIIDNKLAIHYLDLLDSENDICEILCFWSKHPTIILSQDESRNY
ncbi:MAG: hypothetical protein LBH46_01055 [Rickettsiales bacterium]|nr:hypothetical protein [Rickettsiales bacterium]